MAFGHVGSALAAEPAGAEVEVRHSDEGEAVRIEGPEAVYERVYQAYQELETVRLRITIEQRIPETGTPSTITGVLSGSKSAGVVRFEILSPDALQDQVIVVSTEDEMVRTYVPVTDRVIERPLSTVAKDRMDPEQWQSIDELLQLPSKDDFRFKLVHQPHAFNQGSRYIDTEEQRYVLEVRSKEHPELGVQRVWVDPVLWLPTEMAALDEDGVELYHIYLDQIERNVDISLEELVRMP